tara:strand:+ start:56316 stop:56888 length:573 start_codon:yes stop_codon:yes gene_type:complete
MPNLNSTDVEVTTQDKIASHVYSILNLMGLDTTNPDIKNTPVRFAKALLSFSDDKTEPNMTAFPVEGSLIPYVTVDKIEVRSLCAHHLFPFTGYASVVYLPKDEKLGLSKMQRAMDYVATRLTDQESITTKFLEFIKEKINPEYIAIKITCHHSCMSARGVKCHQAETITFLEYANGNVEQYADAKKLIL